MGKLKEHFYTELEAIQNSVDEDAISIIAKCSCPKAIKGMDDLCPHCLAEYEQKLIDNYESYAEEGLVLIEDQNEREIFEASRKKA